MKGRRLGMKGRGLEVKDFIGQANKIIQGHIQTI